MPACPGGGAGATLHRMKEDYRRTRKDLKLALVFGVVMATIEMALLLYFLR